MLFQLPWMDSLAIEPASRTAVYERCPRRWQRGGAPGESTYTVRTYKRYVTIISVRVDDETLAEARRYGINISEALRQGLATEIRKTKMTRNIKSLAKIAQRSDTPTLDDIRALRDGRRY